jgi:hypothetical protein
VFRQLLSGAAVLMKNVGAARIAPLRRDTDTQVKED